MEEHLVTVGVLVLWSDLVHHPHTASTGVRGLWPDVVLETQHLHVKAIGVSGLLSDLALKTHYPHVEAMGMIGLWSDLVLETHHPHVVVMGVTDVILAAQITTGNRKYTSIEAVSLLQHFTDRFLLGHLLPFAYKDADKISRGVITQKVIVVVVGICLYEVVIVVVRVGEGLSKLVFGTDGQTSSVR